MNKFPRVLIILLSVMMLWSGWSQAGETGGIDPYQSINRFTYRFNQVLDDYIGRPAAKIYVAVVPDPVERGVTNVLDNIGEITNVVNDLLQAKFAQAANDAGRFLINTTIGLGGLLEVAEHLDFPKSEGEDFGQTLAVWGLSEGPFLMLPLVGPSTMRDAPAKIIDSLTSPISQLSNESDRNGLRVASLVSSRAELLDFDDVIAGDSYIFIRDIYLQRREYLENDGVIEDDFGDLDDY
ncbi:MAG: VacJ family lipoprotein [Porticoccaceae bacterium]|nr:VacJ family lipoprotein [Porticoccaceae bacterium]